MANIVQINGKNVKDATAARMAPIAPVEASTTASAKHDKGEYFWLNGTLYVATANIASGGTITVGTNCVAAVIGNDFSEIKTAVEELEAGSLSALGASNGQVPVADGAGAWAWGNVSGGGGSSGGGVLVVNVVTNEDDNDSFSADKTYAEIVEHINAGGYVILRHMDNIPLEDEPLDRWYGLLHWERGTSTGNLMFSSIIVYSNTGVGQDAFIISHDNTVTEIQAAYPQN